MSYRDDFQAALERIESLEELNKRSIKCSEEGWIHLKKLMEEFNYDSEVSLFTDAIELLETFLHHKKNGGMVKFYRKNGARTFISLSVNLKNKNSPNKILSGPTLQSFKRRRVLLLIINIFHIDPIFNFGERFFQIIKRSAQ